MYLFIRSLAFFITPPFCLLYCYFRVGCLVSVFVATKDSFMKQEVTWLESMATSKISFNTDILTVYLIGFYFLWLTPWPHSVWVWQFIHPTSSSWEQQWFWKYLGTSKVATSVGYFVTTIPVLETTGLTTLNTLISIWQKAAILSQGCTSSKQLTATRSLHCG